MKLILLLTIALCGLHSLCAQAPVNDDCANAIAVNAGDVVTYDNTEATFDGPFHPTCVSSDNDTIFRDVWYIFTPDFTGFADWSLCDQALHDTKIAVYNAGAVCPLQDGDLLDCNDDYGACSNATSRIIFSVESGQSYLLRVGSWSVTGPGVGGPGTFNIGELTSTLPNDFCEQAIPVFVGEDQPVTNEGAITDGPDHPGNSACFGFGDATVQADIWYSFTPDFTGSVIWSACDQVGFDSRLAVYQAGATCPLQDGDLMACNDDGIGCTGYTSKLYFEVVSGETYLMRFGGYNGAEGTGVFDLLQEIPPPPPPNDACSVPDSAWIVTVDMANAFENAIYGTTSDGTFEQTGFIYPAQACLNNTASGEFSDVWYRFNSEGNTELEMRLYYNQVDLGASFYFDLFETCETMVDTALILNACLFGDPDSIFAGTTVFNLPDEPTEYLLRVATHTTYYFPGDYFFFLIGETPTPNAANEVAFSGTYEVVPNPAGDKMSLNLLLGEPVEMKVRVLNAFGQAVLTRDAGELSPGSHRLNFDVSNLAQGVYFVELQSEKGRGTLRFLKQ